jgi:pseudouridylate synthase
MEPKLPPFYRLSAPVARALSMQLPVVALESTVISHGLPYPENRQLAEDMESELLALDVTPATISVLDGVIRIGTPAEDIERLARGEGLYKITTRDLAPAVARRWSGGTTVAATMQAAYTAGIRVFATGGIGGVHRRIGTSENDVSADLAQLSSTPMVVVCAGAKAILDLPATLEYLETASVPVVGYGVDDFPAFYSRSSGLKASARADSPQEVAEMIKAQWKLGLQGAILVVVPPPEAEALAEDEMHAAVEQALVDASAAHVTGKNVTPFLLSRVSELTGGASLRANLALLRSNARTAAAIARALYAERGFQHA